MKKFLTAMLMAIFLLSTAASVNAAKLPSQMIAVVIIGGSDYKTSDFMSIAKSAFKAPSGMEIVASKEVQSAYKKYWINKGMIDEGEPSQAKFIEYARNSGYNKVIYLVIQDSVVDSHQRKKGKARARASVTVNAFLVNRSSLENSESATNEEDSKTSELRARRGAFEKCLSEISKPMNESLKRR